MVKKDGAELQRADVRPRRTGNPAPSVAKLGMGASDRYLGRQRSINSTARFSRRRSTGAGGTSLIALSPAAASGPTRTARTTNETTEESEHQNDPDAIDEIGPRISLAL